MKTGVLIIILSVISSIYAMSEVDSLLIKGDEYYFKGNLEGALDLYFQAESIDPSNQGAKEGIYNASINSGGIKTANDYAYKLLKLQNSQINQDRVIYSDALLGKTSGAEKFLKQEKDFYRRKAIYSLTGWGLKQTGYSIKTADWYKKAMDDGFKSDEFETGYRESSKLLKDDNKYLDVIFSFYDYGGNDLLLGGYNFNLNYNFGPQKHKFNVNLVMQGTSVDKKMNQDLGFTFYEDINQYELFGQYNYYLSRRATFYAGLKAGWLINDYIQDIASASAGCRFSFTDFFRANTFLNASALSYNFYDINEFTTGNQKNFITESNSLTSLQYTFDGAFTYSGIYLGGIINIVQDSGSSYAEDMLASDRDSLITNISDNIIKNETRYLYGVTAGYNNEEYDIFSSYTTGDMFLVNTSEGRYLNTNDSKLKMNILGGVIFKKLFGDWIIGYTLSYSDFEDYSIMTNSIIANYRWR
jgi:hypothetical protein